MPFAYLQKWLFYKYDTITAKQFLPKDPARFSYRVAVDIAGRPLAASPYARALLPYRNLRRGTCYGLYRSFVP